MKKCNHCGKTLPKGRSKFCSDKCKLDLYKKTNRKIQKCEICGKELTGRKRKFCSNECRMIAQGKLDETIKTCEVCGKLLTGNRTAFCSNECFEKAKADGRYTYSYTRKKKNNVKSVVKKIRQNQSQKQCVNLNQNPIPKRNHIYLLPKCARGQGKRV